jgi:hypothetical protein
MPTYCAQPTNGVYAATQTTNIASPNVAHETHNAGASITAILIMILVILVVLFIQALVVMLLWNWVIPRIWIGAPQIGFGTAFGLVLLIDVLSGIWAKPFWLGFNKC